MSSSKQETISVSVAAQSQTSSTASTTYTRKPTLRRPSDLLRRALSRTSEAQTKDKVAFNSTSPQITAELSENTTVRDGTLFHVRVTLGYLKALARTEKKKNSAKSGDSQADTALVTTAFASVDSEAVLSDHAFALSMPFNLTSPQTSIVWPRPKKSAESSQKCSRRLYFSTMLQKDNTDTDAELRQCLTPDDEVSTSWKLNNSTQSESYSPELVKIRLGLARGKDLLHLGIATLVINGQDVTSNQLDLPIRALLPGEEDGAPKALPNKKIRKGFFGKHSKDSFASDPFQYQFTPNALLRIRLDVSSEATSIRGPALWGDADDDDNDSFFSASKSAESAASGGLNVDIIEEEVLESTSEDFEAVEVVNNLKGTTILSIPAFSPAEPENDTISQDRSTFPISSVIAPKDQGGAISLLSRYEETYSEPSLLESAMLCGGQNQFIEDEAACIHFDDSSTIATSHYKGTPADEWKKAAVPRESDVSTKRGSTRATSGKFSMTSYSKTSSRSQSKKSLLSEETDTVGTSHYTGVQSSKSGDQSSSGYTSMGDATAESLHEAKRVLQRYAKRAGIGVDELLEDLGIDSTSTTLMEESVDEESTGRDTAGSALVERYAKRAGLEVEDLSHADKVKHESGRYDSSSAVDSISQSSGIRNSRSGDDASRSTRSRFSLYVCDPAS